MIPFFPLRYPDELFYSICARYHFWSKNSYVKYTIEDLFKPHIVSPAIEFPTGLDTFRKNLPYHSTLTPDSVIENHSLFPLYKPFLPRERCVKVKEEMHGIHKGIHRIVGKHRDTQKISHLRYCKGCIDRDVEQYGEPYWHRVHQEYGVKVCPHHNSWLYESDVKVIGSDQNWKSLIPLDEEYKNRGRLINVPLRYKELFFKISMGVFWLLNSNTFNLDVHQIKVRLKIHLKNKGFITEYDKIRKEFYVSFRDYYTNQFLEIFDSTIDLDKRKNWLTKMVTNVQGYVKPIRLLLILNFLRIDIFDFFQQEVKYEPFGSGPWPCLNPATDHFNERVIEELSHEYDSKLKKTVGTFFCSCGFIYSRTKDGQRGENEKILELGTSWRGILIGLVEREKKSFQEIGEYYRIDSKVIKKHYDSLVESQSIVVECQKRGNYRYEWNLKRSEFPTLTRKDFYKKFSRQYSWLIRNDKDWLYENLPPKKKYTRSYTTERVNWVLRDNELQKEIIQVVEKIRKLKGKPQRVTKKMIASYLQYPNHLEWLNKLPKTQQTLKDVVETIEDYHLRKVSWAIKEILESDRKLSVNNICKLAGKYETFSDKVKEFVTIQVEKNL
jgi:hypothetical protein